MRKVFDLHVLSDPVLLQRLLALLSGDMSDSLIDRGVVSLKEEWMK